MKYMICIDVGTQSLRSALFTVDGQCLFSAGSDYAPNFYPGNRAEQDPATWQAALMHTLRAVGDYAAEQGIRPEGISITSQRASVIPMSAEGKPLYHSLMWQDKRATAECDFIRSVIGEDELYKKCGLRLDPYFSLPKMLWLKNNRPDVWEEAVKFIGVQDYICYLLTGKYVTDHSQACRTMLLDLAQFTWNDELLEKVGIEKARLCDLVAPGGVAGGLTAEAAAAVNLSADLPVILAGGDQQCAALAQGLFAPGTVTVNTGTGSFVLGFTDKPAFDKDRRILCSAAAIPGGWIVEAGIYASGATYNWCRKQLFDLVEGELPSFEAVNKQVLTAPAGSNGLLVIPHFSGSAAPYWNPIAKGLVFNMGLGTTRGEMCRAILEGIAGEIAENIGIMQENTQKAETVYASGGLTNFEEYCSILADNLQLKVNRRKNTEATLLGCLLSACVTMGIYPDYRTAFTRVVSGECREYQPRTENKETYEKARALRKDIYNALSAADIYTKAQQL